MLTACQHQLCDAGPSTCLLWLLFAAVRESSSWHMPFLAGRNWHTAVDTLCLLQHPALTSTTPGSDPEASGARQKGEPSLTAAFCFLMESLQVHSGWPSCRSCHR